MKSKMHRHIVLWVVIVLSLAACSTDISATPTATGTPTVVPTLTPTATPSMNLTPVKAQSMFRGDPARQGVYEVTKGQAEWIREMDGPIFTSPLVMDDKIYISSEDGVFIAAELNTGETLWSFTTSGGWGVSPAANDDLVIISNEDGNLYALDANNGIEKWKFKSQLPFVSSPAILDGVVYSAGLDGLLYALNIENGKILWKTETKGPMISSANFFGEALLVGDLAGFLYAIDRSSGEILWEINLGEPTVSSPAIAGGFAFVGGGDETGQNGKNLFAIDLETQEIVWKFETNGPILCSPAVFGDTVYFGSFDGNFYAVDQKSGDEIWSFPFGTVVISSPSVTEDSLYFGEISGTIYALDRKTGQIQWQLETGGELMSSPVVAGDYVYIGGGDNSLYAMQRSQPVLAMIPAPTPLPPDPTPTTLPKPIQAVTTGSGDLPWWNDRVFYEVFVRSFKDSDGDGIGDLQGLISMLDYLNDGDPDTTSDLGITGIWLMPVAQSPSYHGYDTIDYLTIEEDYGTNDDFKQLIEAAHQRGIAVIVDLVLNHTSNQHPWFIESQTPGSEHENWYIWSATNPQYLGPWGQSVWHKESGRFYYGLFYYGMPDLNYNNGPTTTAMLDVTRFWLEEMGVDGFRLDAIRHLIEDGEIQENTPATHNWLKNFYNLVHTVNPNAFTIGEAWDETEESVKYVGDEVDTVFEFDLAQAMHESAWRGLKNQLIDTETKVLEAYPRGQYGAFLTNHDQNRVINQVRFDTGSAKVAATLLLTNPGVPFIYYGEEIGMRGAKPDERIRTPMQWDDTATAGFTTGTPWQDLQTEFEDFNVLGENQNPNSILNHYRALINLRQSQPALRTGDMIILETSSPYIYAFLRHLGNQTILVLVNLDDQPVSDYLLSLESGPLPIDPAIEVLFGTGEPAEPEVNANGGFTDYQPVPELPMKSSLILLLSP